MDDLTLDRVEAIIREADALLLAARVVKNHRRMQPGLIREARAKLLEAAAALEVDH